MQEEVPIHVKFGFGLLGYSSCLFFLLILISKNSDNGVTFVFEGGNANEPCNF